MLLYFMVIMYQEKSGNPTCFYLEISFFSRRIFCYQCNAVKNFLQGFFRCALQRLRKCQTISKSHYVAKLFCLAPKSCDHFCCLMFTLGIGTWESLGVSVVVWAYDIGMYAFGLPKKQTPKNVKKTFPRTKPAHYLLLYFTILHVCTSYKVPICT
jgi:hypothetical protein